MEIRKYSNYLDFLNAYVEAKRKNPAWSLGVWKRQLNLKSTSTLTMVLKGQRQPGQKLMEALVRHFEFTGEDRRYFESLVETQKKVKDPSLALFLLKSPSSLVCEPLTQESALDHLLFKRLTHIFREMTQLRDFILDFGWIQQTLKDFHSERHLRKFYESLLSAGLLQHDENGKLLPTPLKATSLPPPKEVIRDFHKEVLAGSLSALNNCQEEDRSFHVTFLNIRADKLKEARQKIMDFQNEFSDLFEETPGDRVYQLSIQFVPAAENRSQKQ